MTNYERNGRRGGGLPGWSMRPSTSRAPVSRAAEHYGHRNPGERSPDGSAAAEELDDIHSAISFKRGAPCHAEEAEQTDEQQENEHRDGRTFAIGHGLSPFDDERV